MQNFQHDVYLYPLSPPPLPWDIKLTTFPRGTTYYNNLTIPVLNHVRQYSFGERDCPQYICVQYWENYIKITIHR